MDKPIDEAFFRGGGLDGRPRFPNLCPSGEDHQGEGEQERRQWEQEQGYWQQSRVEELDSEGDTDTQGAGLHLDYQEGGDKQVAVRGGSEEAVVQGALARIRRAQEKGRRDVKLTQEELDALERRRIRMQAAAAAAAAKASKKGSSGSGAERNDEVNEKLLISLLLWTPSLPVIPRKGSQKENLAVRTVLLRDPESLVHLVLVHQHVTVAIHPQVSADQPRPIPQQYMQSSSGHRHYSGPADVSYTSVQRSPHKAYPSTARAPSDSSLRHRNSPRGEVDVITIPDSSEESDSSDELGNGVQVFSEEREPERERVVLEDLLVVVAVAEEKAREDEKLGVRFRSLCCK
ncbi:hypothetical protein DID88_005112 [Monilinia fructigena]|uniref:Uncharacterized protein n=1 Tax=Monilinia fructigena TaxID=38457 RepID=A0A395IQH6_9HELO|nr:hypothetical protein DID88_005112 [Monilinia fructigena]